jgi:predicted PurR-regulated permease PerM
MKNILHKSATRKLLVNLLLAVLVILAYKAIMSIEEIVTAFKSLMGTISPFFYGLLLAYVLNIPCNEMQKLLDKTNILFLKKRKKGIAIAFVYILLTFLLFFGLRMIIPAVYESVRLFINNFHVYYQRAQELLEHLNNISALDINLSMESLLPTIQNFSLDSLFSSVNAIVGVSSGVFSGFLILISSIYTLIEKEKFKAFLTRVLKAFTTDTASTSIIRYADRLNLSFKQYIYTQTLDGCILGTLAGIELALMGSQYALVLGIMLSVVNFIPYFGSIIGTIVAVLVVMFSQSIPMGMLALMILLVTQQIDGNIIQPRLMGNSFSISPLLVIISVTVGGAVAGVLGMITAIPVTAIILEILEDVIVYLERKKAISKA